MPQRDIRGADIWHNIPAYLVQTAPFSSIQNPDHLNIGTDAQDTGESSASSRGAFEGEAVP